MEIGCFAANHSGATPEPKMSRSPSSRIKQLRNKELKEAARFYKQIKAILMANGIPVTWVWMPMAIPADESHLPGAILVVHREFCDQLIRDETPCFDLSASLKADEFVSADISSHLSTKGHTAMTRLMHPIVLHAVH